VKITLNELAEGWWENYPYNDYVEVGSVPDVKIKSAVILVVFGIESIKASLL
jgi:hypothetical protein